jgi:hypothetical protein
MVLRGTSGRCVTRKLRREETVAATSGDLAYRHRDEVSSGRYLGWLLVPKDFSAWVIR